MKFNVGDIVRVKRGFRDGDYSSNHVYFNDEMEKLVGTTLTISKVLEDRYLVEENQWTWVDDFFESVDFSKDLITDLSIVTLSNGDRLIYRAEQDLFTDLSKHYNNNLTEMCDVNTDGTVEEYMGNKLKIVKIEQSVYSTVYKSKDVKEMTVEEISKALGYEVKIVKEK